MKIREKKNTKGEEEEEEEEEERRKLVRKIKQTQRGKMGNGRRKEAL